MYIKHKHTLLCRLVIFHGHKCCLILLKKDLGFNKRIWKEAPILKTIKTPQCT